jgi:hypothetical protein
MNTMLKFCIPLAGLLALGACETTDYLLNGAETVAEKINAAEDLAVEKGIKKFCEGDIDMMKRYVDSQPMVTWDTIADLCHATYGDIAVDLGLREAPVDVVE